MDPRIDCRWYLGEKPCKYKRTCHDCSEYQKRGISIVILKLGAIGDALRTTPILAAIKRKHICSYITWITDKESYPILENNPFIDELLVNNPATVLTLLPRHFDLVLCLDKDPSVTSLAVMLHATVRMGFSMSRFGSLDVFNEPSRYALALGIDDELKFERNTRTYQEIVYQMAEIPYHRDEYVYVLPEKDESVSTKRMEMLNAPGKGPRVGLNTGCGDVFATKKWPLEHFIELVRLLRNKLDARVYLLGGHPESEGNLRIEKVSEKQAVDTGTHPLNVFAGILKHMDVIVTADTMALHLGIAVKTAVVGLFGPTCFQEIDFYDRGEAVVVRSDCSPCYRRNCIRETSCMSDLTPDRVFNILRKHV